MKINVSVFGKNPHSSCRFVSLLIVYDLFIMIWQSHCCIVYDGNTRISFLLNLFSVTCASNSISSCCSQNSQNYTKKTMPDNTNLSSHNYPSFRINRGSEDSLSRWFLRDLNSNKMEVYFRHSSIQWTFFNL